MTHCVAKETSTQYMIKVDPPFEVTRGPFAGATVSACNVWIHRPGDPWAYKVFIDSPYETIEAGPFVVLQRTRASLEAAFPGLFDAVVVPVMSDPETNRATQKW